MDILRPFLGLEARAMDLLHDQGASEQVLIDGESLVLEAFHLSRANAGSPLSLFWHMENMLSQLRAAGNTTFIVAFFSCYRDAWAGISNPAYAAVYALLRQRLALCGTPLRVFTSPWHEDYAAFLRDTRPVFLLASDVFVHTLPSDTGPLKGGNRAVEALTISLIFQTLQLGTDVAYTTSLRCSTVTAEGFLTSADASVLRAHAHAAGCATTALALLQQSAETAREQHGWVAQAASHSPGLSSVPQLLSALNNSWRLAAGVWCTAAALQHAPQLQLLPVEQRKWLADLWLLHVVLLRALTLEQRALQHLPAQGTIAHAAAVFIHAVLAPVTEAAQQLTQAQLPGTHSSELSSELADSYDCALYRTLLSLTAVEGWQGLEALPQVVITEWQTVRRALRDLISKQGGVLSPADSKLPVCPIPPTARAAQLPAHQPMAGPVLHMDAGERLLHTGFVQSALAQCGLGDLVHRVHAHALHTAELATSQMPPAALPLFFSPQPYVEVYHWHVRRLLQDPFLTQSTDDMARLRRDLKKVDSVTIERLHTFPGLHGSIRQRVAGLLDLAKLAEGGERQALHRSALETVKQAVKDTLNRQIQLRQRTLARMVKSLAGAPFTVTGSRSLPGGTAQPTHHKLSQSAQAIVDNQAALKQAAALDAELAWWRDRVAPRVLLWAAKPLLGLVTKCALAPIDHFLRTTATQHATKQVALGTRLLVLHAALRTLGQQAKDGELATAPAQQQQQELLLELVLTLQRVRADIPPAEVLADWLSAPGSDAVGPAVGVARAGSKAEKSSKTVSNSGAGKGSTKEGKAAASSAMPSPHVYAVPHKPSRSATCAATAVAVLRALGFTTTAHALAGEWATDACAASTSAGRPGAGSAPRKAAGACKKAGKGGGGVASKGAVPDASAVQAALLSAAEEVPVRRVRLVGAPVSLVRFQLQRMPHLLERSTRDAVPDDRVSGFTPDPWQKRLLDAVDAGSSAVVVAPTSSGKTFIASYVIGKCLQTSDEGRVVLVVPTKALVNQVAAQVYKDFGELATVGVFTRDFRENVESCRVLITVPQCLEILVLSPPLWHWMTTLRYLILDEVHCLNESGGAVWERLIHGARTPILALSATVGNPGDFADWLSRVKATQRTQDEAAGYRLPAAAYDVHLITHTERYNDLQYWAYIPPGPTHEGRVPVKVPITVPPAAGGQPAASLVAAAQAQGAHVGHILHVHPLAAVVAADVAAGLSTCTDLALMPSEALQLHDAMVCETHALPASSTGDGMGGASSGAVDWQARLQALDPDTWLRPDGSTPAPLVSRPAAKAWSRELLQLLQDWLRAGEEVWRDAAGRVLRGLCDPPRAALAAYESEWLLSRKSSGKGAVSSTGEEPLQRGATPHGDTAQRTHLMRLLLHMKDRGLLPCILFNLDRKGCESYAVRILQELERMEHHFTRLHDKALQAKIYEREQSQAAAVAEAAKAERRKRPDTGGGEDNGGERSGPGGSSAAGGVGAPVVNIGGLTFSLDPSLPSPSFTFLDPAAATDADFAEAVQELDESLEAMGTELGSLLLRALRRGVGVHHGGMPTRYRQAVEMLFRSKKLQVVIATGTLAFGIHMPCKAVVMAGDSPFLDALNFRQMSGRAGRRGLDTLGHLIFYHIPTHKSQRLLAAPVPSLRGHLALSTTLVLRLALLSQQLAAEAPRSASGARGGARSTADAAPWSVIAQRAEAMLGSVVREPLLRSHVAAVMQRAMQPLSALRAAAPDAGSALGTTPTAVPAAGQDSQGGGGQGCCVGHVSGTATSSPDAVRQTGGAALTSPMDRVQEQLLHSFALSVRLLINHGLLNRQGQAVGLSGLATHLHWTEPANFLLVRLLTSGVLAKYVQLNQRKGAVPLREAMATLVGHMFQRVPMHPARALALKSRASGRGPSVVILPPLPPQLAAAVKEYNSQVLATAKEAVAAYAHAVQERAASDPVQAAQLRAEDSTLPFTGAVHFAPHSTACAAHAHAPGAGGVAALLSPGSALHVPAVSASPFACLVGGAGDDFATISELQACRKPRIHLATAQLATLDWRDRYGRKLPLNAYVLDMIKHGDMEALTKWNGIRSGDVYDLLKGMQGLLQAVAEAVELTAECEAEERGGVHGPTMEVAHAFRDLASTFCAKFAGYNRR